VLVVPGAALRYELSGRSGQLQIESVRAHAGNLLLSIEGVADRDAAQALVGAVLYVPKDAIPLEAGEYLDADLIGCDIVGIDGREYGKVERVEHFPASDMLVVAGNMIPMVAAIVRSIDLAARRIEVDPPAGLLP